MVCVVVCVVVWLWCNCGVVVVWLWCGCGVVLWCGCSVVLSMLVESKLVVCEVVVRRVAWEKGNFPNCDKKST